MPATLVGANVENKPNYLVIAFCGVMNAHPPIISVSINQSHYTNLGIIENKTFSVNIPSADMAVKTDYCGLVSGAEVDKSGVFTSFYGKLKTAPMIEECPVNLECRLIQTIDFDVDTAYIGEIVSVYTEDRFLTEGRLDARKIDPLLFAIHERAYYKIGDYVGRAWNIGAGYEGKDAIKKKR
jgi:flavin reductase (DIM6/NTAB) family NADH-FMN oxidoreductase RutF